MHSYTPEESYRVVRGDTKFSRDKPGMYDAQSSRLEKGVDPALSSSSDSDI